jgi:hypothetical protein
MNPGDVIDAYVIEVMRRVPAGGRDDIGLELRGLLAEMLAERAGSEGRTADDAMVLAILRDFGTPAEVAARYRPPGVVIIPAEQTRSFVILSLAGVALQWCLTLPRVFAGQGLVGWWFSWGLGSLWWPGFMVMMALAATGLRAAGLRQPGWRPRLVDPDRVDPRALAFALLWFAIGAAFLISLPWTARLMPGALPRVFAFDPDFLRWRAPPVLLLWLASFATLVTVLRQGRWSPALRRLELVESLGFVALLLWWLAAGAIFQARPTDDGARAGIGLILLFILLGLAFRAYRGRTRIRVPAGA